MYNEEATQKACKQRAAVERRIRGELKSTRSVYTSRSGTNDRVLPASQRVRPLPGCSGIGEAVASNRVLPASQRVRPLPGFNGIGEAVASNRVLPASQRVRPLPGFNGIGEMEPVSGYIRRYSECARCLVVWDPESQESGSGLVPKRSPARLIYPAARSGGGPSGGGRAYWCRRLGAP
jgi:hypothetical protein